MKHGFIRTFRGKNVNLLDPSSDMIDRTDLAHHLSLECRWAGAVSRHYSVAEHSIWVARMAKCIVPAELREAACLWGLLHDAHEAYVKDIPTPLKMLLPGYKEMCQKLDKAILWHFGLDGWAGPVQAAVHFAVKQADAWAAWCEAKALLIPCQDKDPTLSVSGEEPPKEVSDQVPMAMDLRVSSQSWKLVESSYLHYLEYALRQVRATC